MQVVIGTSPNFDKHIDASLAWNGVQQFKWAAQPSTSAHVDHGRITVSLALSLHMQAGTLCYA